LALKPIDIMTANAENPSSRISFVRIFGRLNLLEHPVEGTAAAGSKTDAWLKQRRIR
jgi:hypothetical protein